jgi:hypothetical protein
LRQVPEHRDGVAESESLDLSRDGFRRRRLRVLQEQPRVETASANSSEGLEKQFGVVDGAQAAHADDQWSFGRDA